MIDCLSQSMKQLNIYADNYKIVDNFIKKMQEEHWRSQIAKKALYDSLGIGYDKHLKDVSMSH